MHLLVNSRPQSASPLGYGTGDLLDLGAKKAPSATAAARAQKAAAARAQALATRKKKAEERKEAQKQKKEAQGKLAEERKKATAAVRDAKKATADADKAAKKKAQEDKKTAQAKARGEKVAARKAKQLAKTKTGKSYETEQPEKDKALEEKTHKDHAAKQEKMKVSSSRMTFLKQGLARVKTLKTPKERNAARKALLNEFKKMAPDVSVPEARTQVTTMPVVSKPGLPKKPVAKKPVIAKKKKGMKGFLGGLFGMFGMEQTVEDIYTDTSLDQTYQDVQLPAIQQQYPMDYTGATMGVDTMGLMMPQATPPAFVMPETKMPPPKGYDNRKAKGRLKDIDYYYEMSQGLQQALSTLITEIVNMERQLLQNQQMIMMMLSQLTTTEPEQACPSGYLVDPTTGECVGTRPECPAGSTWDEMSQVCMQGGVQPQMCPTGYIQDPYTGQCVPGGGGGILPGGCPQGSQLDPNTGECVMFEYPQQPQYPIQYPSQYPSQYPQYPGYQPVSTEQIPGMEMPGEGFIPSDVQLPAQSYQQYYGPAPAQEQIPAGYMETGEFMPAEGGVQVPESIAVEYAPGAEVSEIPFGTESADVVPGEVPAYTGVEAPIAPYVLPEAGSQQVIMPPSDQFVLGAEGMPSMVARAEEPGGLPTVPQESILAEAVVGESESFW